MIQFLHNPNAISTDDVFTVASAKSVRDLVFNILQRLENPVSHLGKPYQLLHTTSQIHFLVNLFTLFSFNVSYMLFAFSHLIE